MYANYVTCRGPNEAAANLTVPATKSYLALEPPNAPSLNPPGHADTGRWYTLERGIPKADAPRTSAPPTGAPAAKNKDEEPRGP